MKMFNGLVEVEMTTITQPINEVFQAIAETVADNEYDLGDFEEQFEEIKNKIEAAVGDQEEPLVLEDEADENFVYGLAMILGVKF